MTGRTQGTGRMNRAEKREANRARITQASRRVFGARGFHAATIEEIASEAGLSNGAIYYNFESKGDLFFALLEERTEERIARLRSTLARAGYAEASEAARAVARGLKESREWRLLLLEFVTYAARVPALAAKLRAHRRGYRTALAALLEERLRERGGAPAMSADELAVAVAALVDGVAVEELADPGSVPDELPGDLLGLLFAASREPA